MNRFKIVFQELDIARAEESLSEDEIIEIARLCSESDHITEVCGVVREITEPEAMIVTTA